MSGDVRTFQDCYIRLEPGGALAIGNRELERSYALREGRLIPRSLLNKRNGDEWIEPGTEAAFRLPWGDVAPERISLQCWEEDDAGIAKPHLVVALDFYYPRLALLLRWQSAIFPESPWIAQRCSIRPMAAGVPPGDGRMLWRNEGGEGPTRSSAAEGPLDVEPDRGDAEGWDYVDTLPLRDVHCRYEAVSFRDVTDRNNNLVSQEAGLLFRNERREHRGNVMFLSKTLLPSGLLLLKESPTALAHLQDIGFDYRFEGMRLYTAGSGLRIEDADEDGPVGRTEASSAYTTAANTRRTPCCMPTRTACGSYSRAGILRS